MSSADLRQCVFEVDRKKGGLTLTEVGYPADEALAARADQTRARRTVDGPATGTVEG